MSRQDQFNAIYSKARTLRREHQQYLTEFNEEQLFAEQMNKKVNAIQEQKEHLVADIKRLENLKGQLKQQYKVLESVSKIRNGFGKAIKSLQDELLNAIKSEVAEYNKCSQLLLPRQETRDAATDASEFRKAKLLYLKDTMAQVHNRLVVINAKELKNGVSRNDKKDSGISKVIISNGTPTRAMRRRESSIANGCRENMTSLVIKRKRDSSD